MDDTSPHASDAQEFLESDFALLALQVLRPEIVNGIGWGDVSDYLGQIQRVARRRMATNEIARRVNDMLAGCAIDGGD